MFIVVLRRGWVGGALVKGNVEVPMIVENFRYEDGNEYEI